MTARTTGDLCVALKSIFDFTFQTANSVENRHCEPTGRANARPMTGTAKQSMSQRKERMDCFAPLAMTSL
jgi:hypothetical protein